MVTLSKGKEKNQFFFFSGRGPEGDSTRKRKDFAGVSRHGGAIRPHGLRTQFFDLRTSCSHREGLNGEDYIMKAPCESLRDKGGVLH
jgi:hypothetical protein